MVCLIFFTYRTNYGPKKINQNLSKSEVFPAGFEPATFSV
jgi:hypothetical protein